MEKKKKRGKEAWLHFKDKLRQERLSLAKIQRNEPMKRLYYWAVMIHDHTSNIIKA